jgi:molybdate transport system substrate-binding protein
VRRIATSALLALLLAGCSGPSAADEVVVYAAASLTNAFGALSTAFEAAHPGVTVTLNFGASSQLASQLIEGAQADVFASANPAQMQVAADAGRIETWQDFASNRLTVIVPVGNPAGIAGLSDLLVPHRMALVLAAPGVPVREYADQALDRLAESDPSVDRAAASTNLVSEEANVRQVVAKVALGEADAGIVYTTDVTPDVADQLEMIEIPDAFNVTATYPIALVAGAPHPALARQYVDFVLSAEGQAILAGWGFGPLPVD